MFSIEYKYRVSILLNNAFAENRNKRFNNETKEVLLYEYLLFAKIEIFCAHKD